MKISFLASHGGSSARAIIEAIVKGEIKAETGILISNNADSAILDWCRKSEFPSLHISGKTHPETEDQAICEALTNAQTDIVVLSGYMKKIGPAVLASFENRVLNIHPALLPKHGGEGMYGDHVHQAVLNAGEKESGASVHIVTTGIDEGPVIKQSKVKVLPDDSLESLRQRVQATEPALYIAALNKFLGISHPGT